ncbi:hypothetical protein F5Y12DRAFT_784217 [Xylaria sp. FL1777]|nr:hypothetical protein F5Y12DRAFT_784217 [Xylaria sp. FL1777]
MSGKEEVENNEAGHIPILEPVITTSERSLDRLYSKCLSSYQEFLIRCSHDATLDSGPGLQRCYEEYSRLKIWGCQRKAALMPSVPGSLADTVRDHPELEDILFEIYDQIIDSFDRQSLIQSLGILADDCYADDYSIISSHVSGSSSSDDESDVGSGILGAVFESIDQLYQLNNLIRRPRLTNRYLDNTQSSISQPCKQDLHHVRRKLAQWRKERDDEILPDEDEEEAQKIAQRLEDITEQIVPHEVIANRQSAEEKDHLLDGILSRRLAIANMKRREQFSYWDAHPDRIVSETTQLVPQQETDLLSTASTFPSANMSAILLDQPPLHQNEAIYTMYVPTLVGNSTRLRIPELLLSNYTGTTLLCPYCHTTLPVAKMKVRSNWRTHVFRDLRPYICTSDDCSDSERLFTTRRDWICHEMQLHRRQWVCQSCACAYISKSEMANHVRHIHDSCIGENELTTTLDISERPMDETQVDTCPFCYATMSLKELLDHIAGHMEEIALFSLPHNNEDTGEIYEVLPYVAGVPQSSNRSGTGMTTLISPELSRRPASPYKISECTCFYGPWNIAITEHCQNCGHRFDHFCTTVAAKK